MLWRFRGAALRVPHVAYEEALRLFVLRTSNCQTCRSQAGGAKDRFVVTQFLRGVDFQGIGAFDPMGIRKSSARNCRSRCRTATKSSLSSPSVPTPRSPS